MERAVQYVRRNFWDGETFTSIEQAQQAVTVWCLRTAGTRIHGSTCARPVEVFTTEEQPLLLAVPGAYDVPVFKAVKVHRDFHAEVAKALYSLPEQWIGTTVDVRADCELVKFYHRGVLVKVHPRQPAGGRSTDRADLPEHKVGYALRDLTTLIATCAAYGPPNVGIYAERILDDPLPWTRMRTVYRLQGLVRRYGAQRVEQACSVALDLDVVSVNKIASMLERATENATPPVLPLAVGQTATRFSRDPSEFSTTATSLTVIANTGLRGGSADMTTTNRVAADPVGATCSDCSKRSNSAPWPTLCPNGPHWPASTNSATSDSSKHCSPTRYPDANPDQPPYGRPKPDSTQACASTPGPHNRTCAMTAPCSAT